MNAELLAMLGSVPGVSSNRRENEPKTLLSYKAGKMIATRQPNGKYMVTADPRRGTLEVNWTAASGSSSAGVLKLEWRDRRTRAVVDSLTIFPEDDCTYSKVSTGAGRDGDRVYLLQYGNASDRRFFFWMQEKEEGNQDEDLCIKINTFMADPDEASAAANGETAAGADKKKKSTGGTKSSKRSSNANASATPAAAGTGEGGALDSAALMSIMQGLNTSGTESEDNHNSAPQVDALSNILENLGMPQPSNSTTSSSAPAVTPAPMTAAATPGAPAPKSSGANSGGLTLSDLQGAMAGLATTSPPAAVGQQPVGPPLSEVVTPENVIESGILNDESVKAKLIELLPEGQRTEERLMENLRSPQVKQCLKSLTAALCDDEGGSLDGFNSILANFQLRPEDGAIAMAAGNPIQAFLDCILKSVQREKDSEGADE
mmetsp:Transcript_18457/g.26947  ORF Transcript_18457/g.26947 Transcript_18457/m.26947 type:complete len:431 (+) Transcript_18457:64-1356(+)